MREKEHVKTSSKSHLPEKKVSKDSLNKQPSLSELFRQQVRFFSECSDFQYFDNWLDVEEG